TPCSNNLWMANSGARSNHSRSISPGSAESSKNRRLRKRRHRFRKNFAVSVPVAASHAQHGTVATQFNHQTGWLTAACHFFKKESKPYDEEEWRQSDNYRRTCLGRTGTQVQPGRHTVLPFLGRGQ